MTDSEKLVAALRGLVKHVRSCRAYEKLRSDMEFVDLAIAALTTKTVSEFDNELGNRIRITIEGPTSTSENILTPMEVEELRAALNGHSRQWDELIEEVFNRTIPFTYKSFGRSLLSAWADAPKALTVAEIDAIPDWIRNAQPPESAA